ADMNWTTGEVDFTASGSSALIEFISNDSTDSFYGITVDAVTVFPDLTAPAPPAPATDFSWGAPDPFTLTLDPGQTTSSGVQSESDGAGVIAVSASVVPADQGVTVSLDSASAATGAIVPVHVSASVGAAPGVYTATLTGTLNAHTRSVTIPVTVGAINGIPLLYEAVPIKPDGPDADTNEDITDVPGDATKV